MKKIRSRTLIFKTTKYIYAYSILPEASDEDIQKYIDYEYKKNPDILSHRIAEHKRIRME